MKKNKVALKKDIKVLVENIFSLSLLQLVSYILPILSLPYIAKTIGVERFGELGVAAAIMVFFSTLVDYGFNFIGVRDLSRVKDDKRKSSIILSKIIYARVALLIFGGGGLCLAYLLFSSINSLGIVLLLSFLWIPSYALYPEWFFQGIEKMKFSSVLTAMVKIIFTVSVFVFVKSEEDYLYIPIINAVGYLFSAAIAFYIIYGYGYRLVKVSFFDVFFTIRKNTNMFITLIMPNLYTNFSMVLLGSSWGNLYAGIFEAGNRFIGVSQQLINILSRAFFPFLSRRTDMHKNFVCISFFISFFCSFLLYFFADKIVLFFYTEDYYSAVKVIEIMSLSPFFIFLMNAYGTNYLVIHGYERELRNIVIFCSVIGFIASFLLVSKYGYIGAALTLTSVWAIRGVITMIYAKIKGA